MIHMNEALIVEGRYDKSKLSALTDAIIVTTNGFGIYKDAEKRDFIRKLAKERGIVILTDSDNAGRQIRAYITSFVPSNQIRHAYIPDIYGKEKRKAAPSKEGKLGVEGISSEILLEILKEAGASVEGSTTDFQPLTPADLMPLGLTGGVNSATLRQGVLKALDLPENLTTKMLLRWVTSEDNKHNGCERKKYAFSSAQRACGWCKQVRKNAEIHSGAVFLNGFPVKKSVCARYSARVCLYPLRFQV